MSFAMLEWARRQITGDPRRRFLLTVLATYADEKGYCWPSVQRLADDTEMTERVVINTLGELEHMRFIARPAGAANQRDYRANAIKMRPQEGDDPALLAPFAAAPRKPEKKAKAVGTDIDKMFEVFWHNYPNQIGKAPARKKFISAIKSEKATLDQIMAGLERYINKKDDRQWCHPATWLEQERWEDGRFEVVASARRGPAAPGI